MVHRTASRGAKALPFMFLVGALWGTAMAVLESALFHGWYHVQLQPLSKTIELAVNYAVYFGLAAVILYVVVAAVASRFQGRRNSVEVTHAALLSESALGAAVPVLAVANFLWVGPLAARSPGLVVFAITAAAALVCWWFLARLFRHTPPRWRRLVRAALVVWIVAGVLWDPLFGRYHGLFTRAGDKAPAGSHPNVLVIVTDTLRRDFLDCYGASWHASPATDMAAAAGVLFANQIAQSTWTLPSTASLLTGQFPSSHGAVTQGRPVSKSSPFLAESFGRAGFHAGAFTENFHILPRNGFGRGLDEFWAVWLPWVFDNSVLYRITGLLRLPTIDLSEKDAYPETVTSPDQVNWDARVTTDRALGWLDGLDESPFFAYIHYMGPHGPYGPPEYLLETPPPAVPVVDHPRDMGGGLPLGKKGEPVSDAELHTMKTLYAADILYVERQIERVFEWLDASGRAAETIVVLTSDHGEEFYEHGAWNHGGSAFDEVLRVPLVITMPGAAGAGLRIEEVTRHIDVMPTLLDLAGVEPPDGIQGRSLRPLVEGGSMDDPVPAYTEVFPIRPAGCEIVSLVTPPHKIIRVSLDGVTDVMLFDLAADPGELDNIVSALSDIYEGLLSDVDVWDGVARLYTPDTDAVPLDPGTLKKLKSLGYIN
jgi:arylsulfatase A-like enzyme